MELVLDRHCFYYYVFSEEYFVLSKRFKRVIMGLVSCFEPQMLKKNKRDRAVTEEETAIVYEVIL